MAEQMASFHGWVISNETVIEVNSNTPGCFFVHINKQRYIPLPIVHCLPTIMLFMAVSKLATIIQQGIHFYRICMFRRIKESFI